jgi:hypothetical protein
MHWKLVFALEERWSFFENKHKAVMNSTESGSWNYLVSGCFANATPVGLSSSSKAVSKTKRNRDDPGQKWEGNAGTRRRTGSVTSVGRNIRERLGRSGRRLKRCIRALPY